MLTLYRYKLFIKKEMSLMVIEGPITFILNIIPFMEITGNSNVIGKKRLLLCLSIYLSYLYNYHISFLPIIQYCQNFQWLITLWSQLITFWKFYNFIWNKQPVCRKFLFLKGSSLLYVLSIDFRGLLIYEKYIIKNTQ